MKSGRACLRRSLEKRSAHGFPSGAALWIKAEYRSARGSLARKIRPRLRPHISKTPEVSRVRWKRSWYVPLQISIRLNRPLIIYTAERGLQKADTRIQKSFSQMRIWKTYTKTGNERLLRQLPPDRMQLRKRQKAWPRLKKKRRIVKSPVPPCRISALNRLKITERLPQTNWIKFPTTSPGR